MLRRALLVSGVLLSGSFGFASVAGAQTANATANFTGTVTGACRFTQSAYTGGTLTSANAMPTSITGTLPATIACNTDGSVTADSVTPNGVTP
ncbi:MAG: hypothetical protein VKL59_25795, partial [Nostocaceae cyanobacterium]|nr:hypothetical protein [Nostocaceae cyanobacterium]